MLNIGCHLSSSKGFSAMGQAALSIGANTFQFFTRNPRGGDAKPFDEKDASALNRLMEENSFAPIIAHAPYTINCAAQSENLREFSVRCIGEDLDRIKHLKNAMYNFHPGCHVGQGEEIGIQHIVNALNSVILNEECPMVLLETMAGKGSELGSSFQQLAQIIEGVSFKSRVGVCLDTCHVFDGGYNIKDELQSVLNDFDKIIGLNKLYAVHLNDSMHGLLSHKDRHEKIGSGHMGTACFEQLINHEALCRLPFVLETPNDLDGYKQEIALLRGLYNREKQESEK